MNPSTDQTNIAEETFNRDGYVIIDDFLFKNVINELHHLAINHQQIDDQYNDYFITLI